MTVAASAMTRAAAILLVVASAALADTIPDTIPQPAPSPHPRAAASLTPPETVTVTVAGGKMPVSVEPLWEKNVFVAFGSALLGGVIGGIAAFLAQLAIENRRIARRHRMALVRMGQVAEGYRNDILGNKQHAEDAKTAADRADLFWQFPDPMEVDRDFTTEVFDLDLVNRVATINADVARYNRRLDGVTRTHYSLQDALLAGTLSAQDWRDNMEIEAPQWNIIVSQLDEIDEQAREIKVRCDLLVFQFDSKQAVRHRWHGLGSLGGWPLDEKQVAEELVRYDATRKRALDERQQQLEARYGIAPAARHSPEARS